MRVAVFLASDKCRNKMNISAATARYNDVGSNFCQFAAHQHSLEISIGLSSLRSHSSSEVLADCGRFYGLMGFGWRALAWDTYLRDKLVSLHRLIRK